MRDYCEDMGGNKNNHREPSSMEELEEFLEYNTCKCRLIAARWHIFFPKFQGINDEVSLQFAKGFDGKVDVLGT